MTTATEAADHVFISISRFRDLVAAGTITRMPSGKYKLDKVREEYCLNAQKVMAGRAADGGAALSKSRARLAEAQTRRAEFQNAQTQGQYVEIAQMQRSLESMFLVMREIALGTPGKISDSLTPYTPKDREAIYQIVRGEIYEMLESLADPDGMAWQTAAEGKTKASRR
jgi:phage terminase Nu1 subunit (DNA packaging protein)